MAYKTAMTKERNQHNRGTVLERSADNKQNRIRPNYRTCSYKRSQAISSL